MKHDTITIDGLDLPLYAMNTLIIGSGAASLNAAVRLFEMGQKDIAIATDFWGGGTSNNAGSDKQTYYKLSLAGDHPDSPVAMAQDLFSGGCMHGDIALCEAQHSAQAFFRLVELGVPFPHDRYGAYVGYKTDHDPRGRGTSAGPLTSHLMFEAFARNAKQRGIRIFDGHEVIGLLTKNEGNEKHVIGAIALDRSRLDSDSMGFVIFNAVNVIFGTGGPAGIYKDSVYPESQVGSSGIAFEIGAVGQNLTEWQYGLASTKFRWNLSGTYQQVIPRYVSTDQKGNDEKEFLNDYFPDMSALATAIFLKGYQWPFDPRKVKNYGSSLIDLLVYKETVIDRRRVFLDYTRNPSGNGRLNDFSFDLLGKEAYAYLKKSDALLGTPIQRLKKMNQPAVDLYKRHDIELETQHLEIAVCVQHHNGGLKGNLWWESNIKHLFPVGEVNGTHGVYRPGGSALNSGQVGSQRAALFISKRYASTPPDNTRFLSAAEAQIRRKIRIAKRMIDARVKNDTFVQIIRTEIQERMSRHAAHIRNPNEIKEAVSAAWNLYEKLKAKTKISSAHKLPDAFKNLDLCLTHILVLEAVGEYLKKSGQSRGSYLVFNLKGEKPCDTLGEEWRFLLNEDEFVDKKILELSLDDDNTIKKEWVDIRLIPRQDVWFENVWNEFMRGETVQ